MRVGDGSKLRHRATRGGARRAVPRVVQEDGSHPPRELLTARRFGSHAIQSGAEELDRRVGLEARDGVSDDVGIGDGEAPLDQRAILREQSLHPRQR